jgi:hypothetical protein
MLTFFVPAKVSGSSYINHFIQPDTLIPDPSNPQAWNRYAYVLNNPVRFNDPSGYSADCGLGDSYCSAGKYTPGGIISLYRDVYGKDAKGDSKIKKRLSDEVESYMKNNPDYRPKNDPYLYRDCKNDEVFDWGNIRIFREVRKDYWEERIRNHSGTSDTVFMLHHYYDLGIRSIKINNSYWDWNEVDWNAVKLDVASTFGSLGGLNTVIGGNRLYKIGYGVTEGASVGYALATGIPKGDENSIVLSAGSLAPGPAGTIFSASAVVNDLLGAYQQNYTPYVPSIPRTP